MINTNNKEEKKDFQKHIEGVFNWKVEEIKHGINKNNKSFIQFKLRSNMNKCTWLRFYPTTTFGHKLISDFMSDILDVNNVKHDSNIDEMTLKDLTFKARLDYNEKGFEVINEISPADSEKKQEITNDRFNNIASEFKSVDNVDDIPF